MSSHGMSYTRLYETWKSMKKRCDNANCESYKYYGARGITYDKEWVNFIPFMEWALANGYEDSLSLDRTDPNGNYEPSNCRFVDFSVQAANRRPTKSEYVGVRKCQNGSFVATLSKNGVTIFRYQSRSKNECALKRNEFIKQNNLMNPLNKINPAYEEVYKPKRCFVYYAKDRENGRIESAHSVEELIKKIGVSRSLVFSCLSGKRVSKKYIFYKENE